MTSAFSWRSIFVVQMPVVLLALPAAVALRGRVRRRAELDTTPDRPHVLANLALALLSAALTAALFLLVLLLVEGWRRSPAVAALAVTAVPAAALAASRLFRAVRAGTRSEAVAGSVLIAGGLTGLALLPAANVAWTLAPQVLVGLGLGLSIDALTAAALRERVPRALHGGWTIAARHAGVVIGLLILTPIFTADLRNAEQPAQGGDRLAGARCAAAGVGEARSRRGAPAAARRRARPSAGSAAGVQRACDCRRRRRPRPRPCNATSRIRSRAPRPARFARRSSSRRGSRCWRWCPRVFLKDRSRR